MAEIRNKYLASVSIKVEIIGIEETSVQASVIFFLDNCDLPKDTIIKILEDIKAYKTTEPGHITPQILKETESQTCKPLSEKFDKSLN